MLTRRQFHSTVLAGLPLSMLAVRTAARGDVRLGTITYSFRDVEYVAGRSLVDGIIAKCKDAGISLIELMNNHVEPVTEYMAGVLAAPGTSNNGLRRGAFPRTPEGLRARDELRAWRLATPISYFTSVRRKCRDAGIEIHAYTVNGLGDDFTSDEIDRMFEQAKALGATTISSSATLSVGQKLVPFVERHQFPVAFHNHADLVDPNQLCTPESVRKVLAMSPRFRLNFDVAHYVQANFDPLPMLAEAHDRITHLHIADGRRDNQPEAPFGTGDTPLKQIVTAMRDKGYGFPAMIELEYPVPAGSTSPAEVKKCAEYLRRQLA